MNQTITADFDTLIDRTGTSAMKWERYAGRDIIPFWVADMDFRAPQPILDTLKRRLDHGILGYSLLPEDQNRILINWMADRYNWQVEPEWIVWLPGVVSALNICCRAFAPDNGSVASFVPIYPPFLDAPANTGRILARVPMKEEGSRDVMDLAALDRIMTETGTRLLLLSSPHNPCGTLFTPKELEALAALCARHDVLVCSDEIHADFILEENQTHTPLAAVSDQARDRTITLMAPSKTFNIPGLGISFAVIPNPELRQQFNQACAGILPHPGLMGVLAARTAYRDCLDWLESLLTRLRENHALVAERVGRMKGCRMKPVQATYLAWIDMRETGIPDLLPFFEKAGAGLHDGALFGQPGFTRLNFGCPSSLLEKGLDRMEKALRQHWRHS